jgi:hypothetical protein
MSLLVGEHAGQRRGFEHMDYRYRYSVEVVPVKGSQTPSGWATRSRTGSPRPPYLTGKPTAEKLARWVADFNDSLAPGRCNDHLGADARIVSARIVDHDNNRAIVAEWSA